MLTPLASLVRRPRLTPPPGSPVAAQRPHAAWLVAAVVVGLALRVGAYASDPPVWGDEAWTILNVLDKSFAELAGPLDYNQAAPPLFLWAVKACAVLFGEQTLSLRLVPFLASCGGLVLLAFAGGPRVAVLAAVVLAAGSSKMLGHTAEVKPYTLDFCAAAAVAVWFTRTATRPLAWRLRAAALVCPAVVLLVYPGCFLAGGVLLGLGVAVLNERRSRDVSLLLLAGVATLMAFAVVATGPGAAHQTAELRAYWVDLGHFPNWARPWALPAWALSGLAGIFRYDCYPLGTILMPLSVIGFVALRRAGRLDVAVALAAPVWLALAAGLLGKYPFGGSRLHYYALPGLALLMGAGVPAFWEWLARFGPRRTPAFRTSFALLLGWGVLEAVASPLLYAGRAEYRPAAAFLRERPADEPVVVTDHVLAYYLRGRPGVRFQSRPAEAGRHWLAVAVDPRAKDFLAAYFAGPPPAVTEYPFGPMTVYRVEGHSDANLR